MALFAVLAAFVACTSEPDSTPTVSPTSTPTASSATATPQPTPTQTAPPPSDLTQGGILRLAIKERPPHQDVHQSVSNVLATWGAGLSYSRLFRFQRSSQVEMPSRIPECDLCTSWKQTGPLEFEFQIREDAFWPDIEPLNGRRLTAFDIVFSYQRQMTPGWPNTDLLSNIQEVAAFDDNRLRIRIHAPDSEFFEKLANGRSVVIAREMIQHHGDLFDGPTLGTGPWILEEVSTGGATFETNRGYYGNNGPHVDGLSVQFIGEDSTRATGVRAGLLDFVQTSRSEVESAQERFPELQSVSILRPETGVEIALNASRGSLTVPAVREAVLLSWDMQSAMSEIWGEEFTPSVGLNLPEIEWMVPFEDSYGDMFGDVTAANALINESGVTSPERIQIIVGEFGEGRDSDRYVLTAESLAESIQGLGIGTTVVPVTTRLFAENVWLGGDYDIFVGPPLPVSSLNGQLFGIYHREGPWNTSGFATDRLDTLIEQQAVELDRSKRGELLAQIQDEIMAQHLRFYAGTGVEHWLWQPGVQNLFPDTTGSSGDFLTSVWLRQ